LKAVHLPDEAEIFICHAPLIRRPHARLKVAPPSQSSESFVHMCCNCRSTRREDGSGIWDWIPAYLDRPPQNGVADLCPSCKKYYRDGSA
jgi:hypothetical protein